MNQAEDLLAPAPEARCFYRHAAGLFRRAQLDSLRGRLDAVESGHQAAARTDRERAAIGRGESADSLRMDPTWYDVWREPSPALREAVGPYTWVVYPVQVRIVRALHHRVPWHQDIGYQKLLGGRGHRHLITCFIPLDADPAHRTTLEFARLETGALPHEAEDGFGAGIRGASFDETEHFELRLGDCLLFGDLAVHRTFVPPGAKIERRSFEFRLIRPEDALTGKDYFDLQRGLFVRNDGTTRSAP